MLALACIAVIADRREELLHYANRELLQSQQRLSRLVDTDPLTNLSNRRSLRKTMDSVIDTGGSFIFIDINSFITGEVALDEIPGYFDRMANHSPFKAAVIP